MYDFPEIAQRFVCSCWPPSRHFRHQLEHFWLIPCAFYFPSWGSPQHSWVEGYHFHTCFSCRDRQSKVFPWIVCRTCWEAPCDRGTSKNPPAASRACFSPRIGASSKSTWKESDASTGIACGSVSSWICSWSAIGSDLRVFRCISCTYDQAYCSLCSGNMSYAHNSQSVSSGCFCRNNSIFWTPLLLYLYLKIIAFIFRNKSFLNRIQWTKMRIEILITYDLNV